MRLFVSILALFTLVSCATPRVELAPDTSFTLGHYRVVALEVIPSDVTIGNSPGFQKIQPVLFRDLASKLQDKANGPDVWLTVRVNQLDLQMSTAMALWAGDSFSVITDVIVSEPNTRKEIARAQIGSSSTMRSGIAGAIGNAIYTQDEQIDAMLDDHAKRVVEAIYPTEKTAPKVD